MGMAGDIYQHHELSASSLDQAGQCACVSLGTNQVPNLEQLSCFGHFKTALIVKLSISFEISELAGKGDWHGD